MAEQSQNAGLSTLERLEALEEIKRLKARSHRANDTKDWATYEALHAPDHVSSNDGLPVWRGAKEVAAQAAKMQEGRVTVHQTHNPEITFLSREKAEGVWALDDWVYWMDGGQKRWAQLVGYYFETYEKRDGKWLFTSRRLQILHRREGVEDDSVRWMTTPR